MRSTSEGASSAFAECLIPSSANTAQQRWINDPFAEWVDQGHVERRETAHVAHIDAEIESIGICCFDEGAECTGVGGAIDQLKKELVFKAIHDAEESIGCAGRHKRLGAIVSRHARGEALARRRRLLAIPSKEAPNEKPDIEQHAHNRRWLVWTSACSRSQKLIERDSGAPVRQIDGPGVVQGHSGKKRVNLQRQKFELASRNLWHDMPLALLMVSVGTTIQKWLAPPASDNSPRLPTRPYLLAETLVADASLVRSSRAACWYGP